MTRHFGQGSCSPFGRLHPRSDVGMRLGHPVRTRSRRQTICDRFFFGGTPATATCLFWRKNRGRGSSRGGLGRRRNTLCRRDLPLPVGQQECPLPHRTSHHFDPTERSRHCQLFWHCPRGYSRPRQSVSPGTSSVKWQQVDLSPLYGLCQEGTSQSHAVADRQLLPHP